MTDTTMQFCPYCGTELDSAYAFCPHCGKSLEILQGISLGKQIYLYCMSFLLPPAGIIYFMRYRKSPDQKGKTIGIVSAVITIISLAITVWLIFAAIGQVNEAINKYSNVGL